MPGSVLHSSFCQTLGVSLIIFSLVWLGFCFGGGFFFFGGGGWVLVFFSPLKTVYDRRD